MPTTTDLVTMTITIDAPIERVWRSLTTPSLIKGWFFGVDTESDWTVGSPIVHTGEYQGKPYVDRGEILRFEPPTLLEHSHRSEVSGEPDRPDRYQVVTWALREWDGGTELRLTERNLPSIEAAATSEQAWEAALAKLRESVERRSPRS